MLRHFLQKFFFPNDYLVRPPSYIPQPGEKRVFTHMDISVRLSSKGFFNIPFHDKKDVCHLLHFSLWYMLPFRNCTRLDSP